MVASGLSLQAASGLTAVIGDPESFSLVEGSLVILYVASVRTSARVLRVSIADCFDDRAELALEDIDEIFSLSDEANGEARHSISATKKGVQVQLELLSTREWIELGSPIFVVDGGSKDKSGLGGYVGKVVEIVE